MTAPFRALIVEDEPADAELMVFELLEQGLVLSWERVETEESYLASLASPPDVILADYRLPRFGAMRALELLRSLRLDIPFLVVTGDSREEIAVECMKAGASDFLVKDRLALLAAAVEHALEAKRLREEKARAEREREKNLESLAAAERRFRGIFDSAYGFVGLMDPDGTLLEANRTALEFAGARRDEVVGRPFWEGPWWARSEEAQLLLREAIVRAAAGEVVRFEVENYGAGGSRVTVDFSITPVRDETGRVTLLVPEGYDITARKAAEDELRKHRERLEELVRERTSQLHRSERRAQLIRDVASAANAARTTAEALLSAIRCVAGHWGWPLGHAFAVEASTGSPVESGCWHLGDGERYLPFVAASAPSRFGEGDGFLGKVLASDFPSWLPLPAPPSFFLREPSARAAGLGFACALPVRARDRLFAVLEFLGEEASRPDEGDLELLMQVGRQVAITCDRLEAEAELRKLSLAVAQSPATVLVTDRNGRIEYVNPAFERSTGFSAAEGIGQTPRILKSGLQPPSFYEELWRTILRGETWRGELCNRRKNGELFWESASISPLRSEPGEITGFVAVKLDISARKEAERQLERAKEAAEQANRAKSAFLASMSHEIRTPMNAILGFSQLLMADRGLDEVQREHLASINASGEHLLALINDVLEMSKIEAGRATLHPVPCDLHALLTDVERMFRLRAKEKGLAFEVWRLGELPRHVVLDETKLRQILVNLLGNAMKFTLQGGVIVRVRSVAAAAAGSSSSSSGSSGSSGSSSVRLVVEVEDSGPGIAPHDLPRLFQRFEQARQPDRAAGGTGLGLAISRAFARLMGGDVTVRSRPGEGSVFTAEVAATLDAEAPARGAAQTGRILGLLPDEKRRRALVVDDIAANRKVASLMLARVGFEVRSAGDGSSALDEFARWHPHVVLMDLRMPGMDGLEAIRVLRRLDGGADVPVIAVTASAFEWDRQQVLAAGGTDFIGKPFREADLLRKVGDALGLRYVVEGEGGPDAPGGDPGPASLVVPEELREELRSAVVRADLGLVLELAGRIEKEDPASAGVLRDLAERYEYDRIRELLNGARA